ncbi:MAG: Rpn family recombination-promoting nuclease/putative transposase, partial [Deltaproteobacteria bacterium]|nr:Rpn family recombination-promoting nuclease/putative transposase [Deltaproteobacteria bacterium]
MKTSQVKNTTDIIKDMKYLDPKLDIVFKLLMQQEKSLLQSMIETIVKLPAPIESLEVLNPEIPKAIGIDKGVILDVRVSLANRARFDVEMQSQLPDGINSRFLYYWAKEYCSELSRGDDYVDLL